MPITHAYAQGEAGAAGFDPFFLILMVAMFGVFWFFVFRPQSKKAKQHQAMLSSIKRGDQVVTNGGIIGNVTRIEGDGVLIIEIAKDVRVKCRHSMIADVMAKPEPRQAVKADNGNSGENGGG